MVSPFCPPPPWSVAPPAPRPLVLAQVSPRWSDIAAASRSPVVELMGDPPYLGLGPNNAAEYCALLLGLDLALELGVRRIVCVGDSQLVIHQGHRGQARSGSRPASRRCPRSGGRL